MAIIRLDIPDTEAVRIIDGFATAYGYVNTIIDENGVPVPNPVLKIDFMRKKIVDYIKAAVVTSEINQFSKQKEQDVINRNKDLLLELNAIPIIVTGQ